MSLNPITIHQHHPKSYVHNQSYDVTDSTVDKDAKLRKAMIHISQNTVALLNLTLKAFFICPLISLQDMTQSWPYQQPPEEGGTQHFLYSHSKVYTSMINYRIYRTDSFHWDADCVWLWDWNWNILCICHRKESSPIHDTDMVNMLRWCTDLFLNQFYRVHKPNMYVSNEKGKIVVTMYSTMYTSIHWCRYDYSQNDRVFLSQWGMVSLWESPHVHTWLLTNRKWITHTRSIHSY